MKNKGTQLKPGFHILGNDWSWPYQGAGLQKSVIEYFFRIVPKTATQSKKSRFFLNGRNVRSMIPYRNISIRERIVIRKEES